MIPSTQEIKIGDVTIGGRNPFVLIAGPCIAESEELLIKVAKRMKEITDKLGIPYIFKTSYDKANRSSIDSYRGPGMETAMEWLEDLKQELNVCVITDVHTPAQCESAAEIVDILQIPAFLCRQTDLIQAAAYTKKPVNVKKGQFLAPWDVKNIVDKVKSCENDNVMVTERGTCFGYNNLVVDPRSLPVIRNFGIPVIFDATHSVQLPGGLGSSTDGQREFIPNLSRAAVANGVDALFMEVHPEPEKGLSDATTMYALDKIEDLLSDLKKIDEVVKRG